MCDREEATQLEINTKAVAGSFLSEIQDEEHVMNTDVYNHGTKAEIPCNPTANTATVSDPVTHTGLSYTQNSHSADQKVFSG